MTRVAHVLALVGVLALSATAVMAQSNPCNPCGPDMKAEDPCNPCGKGMKAANACNPCGKGMATSTALMPAVNPCYAKAGTVFYIDDPMSRNQVSFTSEAPLEDITGLTNVIAGYVVFNATDEKHALMGQINVATASLDTGIPLRDEHLQGAAWLNAEANPLISFEVTKAKDVKVLTQKDGATTYEMTVEGEITLNGKTKKVQVPARVTHLMESEQTKARLPGDLLAVRASFPVKLRDFGIKGFDGVVGQKVNDTIAVDVRFVATNAHKENAAANPCNPCGSRKS
jgi:polyisoprenoid-binding protein YceI